MKYWTKCGIEFRKSTKAKTTGYVLCLDTDGNMYETSPKSFEPCGMSKCRPVALS